MDKQDEHFHFLNEKVFKPLSEVTLQRDGLRLSVHFPTDSFLWPSAVKHMMKCPDDLRKRPIYWGYDGYPETIEKIERRIATHNARAAPFVEMPKLTAAVEDMMRDLRGKGEVRLKDLEYTISDIEKDLASIRAAFLTWSQAIEFGQYRGVIPKADCCPTVFTILDQVWS